MNMNIINDIVNSPTLDDKEKIDMLAEVARSQANKIKLLEDQHNQRVSDHAWEIAGIYGNQGGV